VEQKVEYQINDDEEHHDSDDVSGIQGSASWTSVLGKPLMDVSAAEYGTSPSLLREGITVPSRKGGRREPLRNSRLKGRSVAVSPTCS
jgi:hypothetical protein